MNLNRQHISFDSLHIMTKSLEFFIINNNTTSTTLALGYNNNQNNQSQIKNNISILDTYYISLI